jgi:hypothetical protein
MQDSAENVKPMTSKFLWFLLLSLAHAVQNAAPEDGLTAAERTKMAGQQKIDGRIKIYESASQRHKAALSSASQKQDHDSVPEILKSWTSLLNFSFQDIDRSIVDRRKKSKPLIRYEIQLRKAIAEVQALKTAAPVEIFDQLDAWAKQADSVRQKFVQIIFP